MRRLTKIGYSLLGLLALAYVGVTAYGMYMIVWFRKWPYLMWPQGESTGMVVFYGIVVLGVATLLLALGVLFRGLFADTRRRSLLLASEEGSHVYLAEDAVASCVASSLAKYNAITQCDVRTWMHKKKTGNVINLKVECGVREGTILAPLADSLRTQIKEDVEHFTGARVEKVDLFFDEEKETPVERR